MADNFPSMYNYQNDSGLIIPDTDDIKSSVENMMKGIFGGALDTTPETPVGRLIEAITMLMRTTIGVNAQNANQINLASSTGAYLDGLGSLFKVYRLPATKTKTKVVFTFKFTDGTYSSIVPAGTLLATSSGDTFKVVYDVSAIGDEGESVTAIGYAESTNYGATPCAVGELTQIIEDIPNLISVTNPESAIYGRDMESDNSFRTRIAQSRGTNGSNVGAITNAIWAAVPTLAGVIVLENGYGEAVVKNGIELKPHSIFVCVSGDITSEDEINIAKAIWKTKTIGAAYTDNAPTIEGKIVKTITSEDISTIPSGISYDVIYYKSVNADVDIGLTINASKYTGSNIQNDIRSVVANYISGLSMGATMTRFDIASAITSAIPTLTVSNVVLSSSGKEYDSITPNALSMLSLGALTITLS